MTPNETRSMRASGCGEGCSKTPKRPGGARDTLRDTRDQSRGITQTGRYRFKISGPGGATRTGAGDCTPHTPVGGANCGGAMRGPRYKGIYSEFYRGVRFLLRRFKSTRAGAYLYPLIHARLRAHARRRVHAPHHAPPRCPLRRPVRVCHGVSEVAVKVFSHGYERALPVGDRLSKIGLLEPELQDHLTPVALTSA